MAGHAHECIFARRQPPCFPVGHTCMAPASGVLLSRVNHARARTLAVAAFRRRSAVATRPRDLAASPLW
eukprot:5072916-Pleurochrysis_carterae.AAC.1